MLGGIAQAIFDLCTSETMGIGYKIFASVAGILILIAVIMLSYKMMMAGNSTAKKTEAKDNLMRLLLRWLSNSSSTTFC